MWNKCFNKERINSVDEKKFEDTWEAPKPRPQASAPRIIYIYSQKRYNSSMERAKRTNILNVSEYGLKSVPKDIEDMPLLRTIDMSKNMLTELALRPLQKLKFLNVSLNFITNIADCFSPMKRLMTVDLSHNRLRSVPCSLWGLPKLKTVNLSYNWITALEEAAMSKSCVQILDLSNNGLRAISKELLEMARLTELKVANNEISSLPDNWRSAKKLMILDLEGNKISKFGPSIFKDTQIFRINLQYNPCHPEDWRMFDGFQTYVKRYKSHIDKGLYHGGKEDYDKFV